MQPDRRRPAATAWTRSGPAVLFEHDDDLYYARFDGTPAVRLTRSPGEKELATFSPDGRFVAFVRAGNLYVVDVATQAERPLTTDGGGLVLNGKADWVYGEEIFNRNGRTYWWSPDSRESPSCASTTGRSHAVHRRRSRAEPRHRVETLPVPEGRRPEPDRDAARRRRRPAAIRSRADLSGLLAGRRRSSAASAGCRTAREVFFYVQNRAQTWLDVCTLPADGGAVDAAVPRDDRPGSTTSATATSWPTGRSCSPARRAAGSTSTTSTDRQDARGPVTQGEWEVRSVPRRRPRRRLALYVTATRDGPHGRTCTASRLDGSGLERLTQGGGRTPRPSARRARCSSTATATPPRRPRCASADRTARWCGRSTRTRSTQREEFRFGAYERVQIQTRGRVRPGGVVAQAARLRPGEEVPGLVQTYGGPHAPIGAGTGSTAGCSDQALADRRDRRLPRATRGPPAARGLRPRGRRTSSSACRSCKDLEDAVDWLARTRGSTPSGSGMSGHSYGGFMTAYA